MVMSRLAKGRGVGRRGSFLFFTAIFLAGISNGLTNGNVYVSRFWHNHQPLYWPEWNSNGSETNRGQYAWDSIVLKPSQNYGGLSPKQHPENNLTEIFEKADRRIAYQFGPRDSLAGINNNGGFAISYSGSLIDNVRQLGSGGHLGYTSAWHQGIRDARGWITPSGSTRMDMLGFTHHHSLGPHLPKSVFRKEIQTFKQAWWKAWGGNSDLSDHSKGFFPTEMAYSRHLVDVLVDEGFEWTLVASHHISRTSPSYNDRANPTNSYNIYSSPPNKADQISPRFDNPDQWWFSMPNPGNSAWNVAPFAYQLHRVKYVNPETGAEKKMYAVPSDDVLSYRYGYANEGIGKIVDQIAPHASVPVIVIPATDGDNAWGGGSDSWGGATKQLFGDSAARGYKPSTPQDFVNAVKGSVTTDTHIEDGAWIFPEMCYGSPNFMKWIEPPVATVANRGVTTVPGTQIDMETPGFALKFYSYAPLMAGANWVETAEQILRDEGGSVEPWKIAAPYDWNGSWVGSWTSPNEVEQAWHIYLKGLDSGFNYYGGLGNDDEVKPGLATRRAIEKLEPWMTTVRRNNDRTPPTVLKPQRFPYNPGGYTFGWFNNVPGVNGDFLKRMNSEFYIWTHAYDLSGIPDGNVKVKIRIDNDGTNPMASNQNETYAGGSEVGTWVTLGMTKRVLPNTRAALNAAAANPGEIDYFLPSNEQADYYFVKITDNNLPNFRSKLLDYYIEATDAKGNLHKSEIQHVWVDDFSGQTNGSGGGGGTEPSPVVTTSPNPPLAGQSVTITYNPAGRPLASASNVFLHYAPGEWNSQRVTPRPAMASTNIGTLASPTNVWRLVTNLPANASILRMVFTANPEISQNLAWDNNAGADWNINVASPPPSTNPPFAPTNFVATASSSRSAALSWDAVEFASGYVVFRDGQQIATPQDRNYNDRSLLPETTYRYFIRASNSVGSSGNSATNSITTPFSPLAGSNLVLLSRPSQTILTNYPFRGRAGASFISGLTWTNLTTGVSGAIPFPSGSAASGWEWDASIPLLPGTNQIRFGGAFNNSWTNTLSDSATNYTATTWTNGSLRGSGFGPWVLINSGQAGHFWASNSNPNMQVDAPLGFGLWGHSGGQVSAIRNFSNFMTAGDLFRLRFDNNSIQTGGQVGFALADTNGTQRFRFYFVGGELTYRISDQTTNRQTTMGWTNAGFALIFELSSPTNYVLRTPAGPISGTLAAGGPIQRLIVQNNNSGSGAGGSFDLFFGEMSHVRVVQDSASVVESASIVLESSTDGISDSWWTSVGITGTDRVAANDADGDGFTNAQEFSLGTDPMNSGSSFKTGAMTRTGNFVTISWSSVSGKTYQVQKRASLTSGNWSDVGDPVTASGPSTSTTVDISDAPNACFLRVKHGP